MKVGTLPVSQQENPTFENHNYDRPIQQLSSTTSKRNYFAVYK